MRLASFFLLCLCVASAAPLERELGGGLAYFRLQELPADLPAKPAGQTGPCVIDVRFLQTDANGATAFLAWLKFRASPRSPVFVLANVETSPVLRQPLAEHERGTGIVVVGIPAGKFQPDVAASGSAANERRAYDALQQGAATAVLLADNPDKVRNDEASLSKDRLAEASADAAEDAISGKRTPPPIDVTLQRAVHLHHALVALKRI